MAALVSGQAAVACSAADSPTLTASLPSGATAGNLLVYAIGGDKDVGILTMTGTGWSTPVNLRSTSVSLVLSWKVAAGGETALTGTITAPTVNGSSLYVGEYSEAGAGAWEVKALATANSTEANTLTQSTGTTGAATGDGRAIAIFSVDSISTEGTTSYTNSYTERANPTNTPTSSGSAGLWVAERDITAPATTEATITRAGGAAADQMSGAVVVFGRAVGGGGGSVAQTRAMLGLL